jgi:hypothetical protein
MGRTKRAKRRGTKRERSTENREQRESREAARNKGTREGEHHSRVQGERATERGLDGLCTHPSVSLSPLPRSSGQTVHSISVSVRSLFVTAHPSVVVTCAEALSHISTRGKGKKIIALACDCGRALFFFFFFLLFLLCFQSLHPPLSHHITPPIKKQ